MNKIERALSIIDEAIRAQSAMTELNHANQVHAHHFAVVELVRVRELISRLVAQEERDRQEIIRTLIEGYGMPVSALSQRLGISRTAVYNIINDRHGISPDLAARIDHFVSVLIANLS